MTPFFKHLQWLGCAVGLLLLPALTSAADIAAGKRRAEVCFACHSVNGVSKIPGTPHLAGQQRDYLEKALRAYRDGTTRQDPTMTAMAKPLNDADIVNIAAYFNLAIENARGEMLSEVMAVNERIKPVATVQIAPATKAEPRASRTGDAIYTASCSACHGTGAAGAPKLGDKAAWQLRLSQGQATLYEHAIKGLRAMPARGACTDCSDDELKAAVDYLVDKSK
nr:c-type cytochrome [Achromobacter ruhlandii]